MTFVGTNASGRHSSRGNGDTCVQRQEKFCSRVSRATGFKREKKNLFSAVKRCRGKKNQGTDRKARSSNPHPTIFSHTPLRVIKGDFYISIQPQSDYATPLHINRADKRLTVKNWWLSNLVPLMRFIQQSDFVIGIHFSNYFINNAFFFFWLSCIIQIKAWYSQLWIEHVLRIHFK